MQRRYTRLLRSANQFKDRRLIVLFFDLSAMEPDEIDRAVTAAEHYVDTQMAPADLVSIVSLGSALLVNQDFTADHELLKKQLQAFSAGSGQGFEEGTTGTTEGTPDTGQPFTADDTEYNIFNTDRRLEALRSVAEKLSHLQQKKSLIYFSSGMDRTGIENQSELRAAINAAVRSNMAIYTMDLRGLQALVAGGEAQNASMRGTSPYSGQSTINALNSNFTTQESLVTLASDTGGRAFLDSNDFTQVFKGVQHDTSTYYLLGYHSSNPARDGRYRRIAVKVNVPGVKVDFRRGYYAPADYRHSTKEDKELQLQQELASELPTTDLPLYLSTAYFRLRGQQVLHSGVVGSAGLGNSLHAQQRSGQSHSGCHRHRARQRKTPGHASSRHGQPRRRYLVRSSEEECAVQHRAEPASWRNIISSLW